MHPGCSAKLRRGHIPSALFAMHCAMQHVYPVLQPSARASYLSPPTGTALIIPKSLDQTEDKRKKQVRERQLQRLPLGWHSLDDANNRVPPEVGSRGFGWLLGRWTRNEGLGRNEDCFLQAQPSGESHRDRATRECCVSSSRCPTPTDTFIPPSST